MHWSDLGFPWDPYNRSNAVGDILLLLIQVQSPNGKKFIAPQKKLTHWQAVVAQGFKSSTMFKHSWCLKTRVWTPLEAAQLAYHIHTHLHPHPTYPHPSYMILLLCVCYFLVRFSFSFDKERKVWRLFSWSKNDCQKTFCFWKKKVLTFTLELPAIQLGFDYSPKIRLW